MVLIHGAATTGRVWRHVARLLPEFDVSCPDRPCSGDLATEVAALRPLCEGAIVAGVSGGATLGLALAAEGTPIVAGLLHEPAVGSLLPGLLNDVVAAYKAGGAGAFAHALYGPTWTSEEAPPDPGAVERDLAMFRAFEPAAPAAGAGPVVISVGESSPPIRHACADALRAAYHLPVWPLRDARHAVHLEHPAVFAAAIRSLAAQA